MDAKGIKGKLAGLAQRDWPREWGQREEETIGDYFGWCHRYRLDEPLEEIEVAAFERRYGVDLPADYRQFLLEVGNGGAGPGHGIYRLGEEEVDPLPEDILRDLARDFSLTERWNDSSLLETPERYYGHELMAGAMPIASKGCALDYWLVVTGPGAGQIWFDKRTDSEGVEPIIDETGTIQRFGDWYEAWLDEAYSKRFGSQASAAP